MADYSDSKAGPALFPLYAVDSSWSHLEPLITAQELRDTVLWGLVLQAGLVDPATGKKAVLRDPQIDRFIINAVALAETEVGISIFPNQHTEKLPFDATEFRALGYFKIKNRPISSVEKLAVTPANGIDIYVLPNDWIEVATLPTGQINIVPINIATTAQGNFVPMQSGGGAFFLSILGSRSWIPAFWNLTFTTGYPDGKIPRVVNELIATIAAIEILGALAATFFRNGSHSLGLDGLSQSISMPQNPFQLRIQELMDKRKMLTRKLRALYGLAMFSNSV